MYNSYLKYHDEVREALSEKRPVVALESTIISHGMPYPDNIETARTVEDIVRKEGAVPATIALIDGFIHIGLDDRELEFIATCREMTKASRRDLPILAGKKLHGATTVSATMYCAQLAGIKVFVTGGIGGAHRGAQQSFDISADLTELSKTSVAVVCSGAKAILDLPLTLERLETLGVPVLGYGTDEFPSFYSRTSGLAVDCPVESAAEVAAIMLAKWHLGLKGGLLIANPIPPEDEIPFEEMNEFIDKALREAQDKNIRGKALTPFLLATIADITAGKSQKANRALVESNAHVGGAIAVAYAELCRKRGE